MKALAALGLGASLLLGAGVANAQETCTSTLDHGLALFYNYGYARATFGSKSMFGPSGGVVPCGSNEINCWNYREPCNDHWIDFWSGSYSHFHLFFDNPAYNEPACFCDPGDGKGAGFAISTQCTTCPTWYLLGRRMMSHVGSAWSQIHVRSDYNCTQGFAADCNVPFTFNMLNVGGDRAVEVWILNANWQWTIYGPLAAGVNWNWGGVSAREVWIKAANNSPYSYTINGYTATVL